MHLNDAFTRNKSIHSTFMHHEQALTMAAEGYARTTGRPAIVNVTTGPGGLNALNGVFGAFVDSVPMFVVSGQVRTETIARLSNKRLRQLGDQEADIYSTVRHSVKYFAMPTDEIQAVRAISCALECLFKGRLGPVWIDIPINIQGLKIMDDNRATLSSTKLIECFHPNLTDNEPKHSTLKPKMNRLIKKLKSAKRPLFIAGSGVRISQQQDTFLKVIERMHMPTVTGWNAHDLLPNSHACYCGKPGTVGERAGNFAVRNADFVLVMGCRLNIRQVSYNWQSFAPRAEIFMVDIDRYELEKMTLNISVKFHFDLKDFFPSISDAK